jgi:two-component system response regulator YesN
MITVVIVEDEKISRNGLTQIINWESLDMKIVGLAENGIDGLELVKKNSVDLILTDIRMPFMDGLEFIEAAQKINPDTLFIIITGYEDFSYAKRAITLGVHEYLLKPINIGELLKSLQKVSNNPKKKTNQIPDWITSQNINQFKSDIFKNIVNENKNYKVLLERAKYIGIDLTGPLYQVLIIKIDYYYSKNIDITEEVFIEKIAHILTGNTKFSIFKSNQNVFFVLLNHIESEILKTTILCREIKDYFYRFGKPVTLYLGSVVNGVDNIGQSYREAQVAFSLRFSFSTNQIIHYSSDIKIKKHIDYLNHKEQEEYINHLINKDKIGMKELIHRIINHAKENLFTDHNIKELCNLLITLAVGKIYEMRISIELPDFNLEMFEKYDDIDEIFRWILEFLYQLMYQIKNNKVTNNDIVMAVIRYIELNYHKDIGLGEIARACHITPNYLSNLYKAHVGENIIETLNKKRVEKAKKLISTGKYKIKEISKLVGYNSEKSLIYNFKHYTGNTPRDYKYKINNSV